MSPNPRDLLALSQALCDFYRVAAFAEAPPPVLDIPDVRQETGYDCGAAAVKAVRRFFGRADAPLPATRSALGTNPATGTRPGAICFGLAAVGLAPELRENLTVTELARYVASGRPVVCCVQRRATPGERSGHWVVVCGADESAVTVQDPLAGRVVAPAADFVARWHDSDGARRYVRLGIVPRETQAFAEPRVHTFAGWSGPFKGPRGGTYWLREGAQDVEANRVYGDQPGDGTDPARQDIRPAIDTASRVLAGATVGGLTGSALAGPVGAVVGGVAGAALGTDTANSVLGGVRGLLNRGEEPEGVARKVAAGDPEAVAAVRADASEGARYAAAELARLPPGDPAEVRAGWRQASAGLPPADADELGGHVEALASARDTGAIGAAFKAIGGFLVKLAGGALRLAFGAIKAFGRWATGSGKKYLIWAATVAATAAVMAAPPAAIVTGLVSQSTGLLMMPLIPAAPFVLPKIGGHLVNRVGAARANAGSPEEFAEGAGWTTIEHVKSDPAGALELIKKLAGRVRQVVGFSEDGAGWTAEGVRRNPAGALACIERLRKRVHNPGVPR